MTVFGLNSAKFDLNSIESFSLPILVNKQDFEPTVIKKANQFLSFQFGDFLLLDFMKFLQDATSLDYFLKAYTTNWTKSFFHYEWFDFTNKLSNKAFPPYDSIFNIVRNSNPL